MDGRKLPTLFDIKAESEEARNYLSDEIVKDRRIRPLLTLYKDKEKILSVHLPLTDTVEEREVSLYQLSWLTASVGATGVRFIIDTTVSFPQPDETTISKDILLVFYANPIGCMLDICHYEVLDNGSVAWHPIDLDAEEFIKTQQHLVNLLASQMFFNPHPVPFEQHLGYLESKGHELMYHEPFTPKNLGYAQTLSI